MKEQDLSAELCAELLGQRDRNVTVGVTFTSISASTQDYDSRNRSFFFNLGVNRTCISVAVEEDRLLEDSEDFVATLVPFGVETDVVFSSSLARVTIESEDRKLGHSNILFECYVFLLSSAVTVSFVPDRINASESSGVVSVCIGLISGTLGQDITLNILPTGDSDPKSIDGKISNVMTCSFLCYKIVEKNTFLKFQNVLLCHLEHKVIIMEDF